MNYLRYMVIGLFTIMFATMIELNDWLDLWKPEYNLLMILGNCLFSTSFPYVVKEQISSLAMKKWFCYTVMVSTGICITSGVGAYILVQPKWLLDTMFSISLPILKSTAELIDAEKGAKPHSKIINNICMSFAIFTFILSAIIQFDLGFQFLEPGCNHLMTSGSCLFSISFPAIIREQISPFVTKKWFHNTIALSTMFCLGFAITVALIFENNTPNKWLLENIFSILLTLLIAITQLVDDTTRGDNFSLPVF